MEPKMNLLMLGGDSSVAQGREGAFSQMLSRFSAYWDRIDILCPAAPDASERRLYGKVHVHPSRRSKILQPWFIRQTGRALMNERRYDLITSHDFGFFYNGLGAAWLHRDSGVPYVSEIHHVEGYPRAVTHRERLYRALASPYIRWASRRVAAFRAVNRVEVPELLRRLGVPDDKILVLPSLYLDFDLFGPIDLPKHYDAVFVGRLMPNKGLFTLLDAVAQVKISRPDVRVALLGRGPLEADVRGWILALGLQRNVMLQTEHLGAGEVARFYNSARMLICASTAEGGPRVTVEAMACGVPVISTPVGMMRELIDDGTNGLLFQWNSSQLADRMRLLLSDDALRQRIADKGRESVQGFQADAVIERYARGYHDLIARLKGP
jgi:glycosyltransferase involved in cell wall biosynthesis